MAGMTRRQWIGAASGAAAAGLLGSQVLAHRIAPAVVPASVLGRNSPSNRITIGMIGVGRQGIKVNLAALLAMPEVRLVALCDVDAWRLNEAKKQVEARYGDDGCTLYNDWRELVARDDIDAVMNSTPDHWHVPISLAAVQAGKHVSCEKPLTLSVAEGRRLADAVGKAGVVFRTDTECRSHTDMHRITELVRNGCVGKVKHVDVGVPEADKAGGNAEPMPVPEELDYEMWRGHAPWKPYTLDAVHPVRSLDRPGWMRCSDTCEGVITNWGTHVLDVAQHILDRERTGPVEVECTGVFPEPGSGLWDVLVTFEARFRYADGVTLRYHTDPKGAYVKVEGENGWIHADWLRAGPGLIAHDQRILETKLTDEDVRFPQRSDKEDFINAILNDVPTMIDAEIGHRTCSMGQIAHIAIRRGKKLAWDPDTEAFTNDDEANKMLERPSRNDWERS
jgi:predicted dehydrogenase